MLSKWNFQFQTSPLHQAVIENNLKTVEELKDTPWRNTADKLGFTPLELARLLGKKSCQEILGRPFSIAIKVQSKGETSPKILTADQFEQKFKITYRPYLTFPSYSSLKTVISNCPYILRWKWLTKENYEWAALYQKQLSTGSTAKLSIKWINEVLGWGAFLDEDLSAGSFIGEYAGVVRPLSRRSPDHNAYCFHYPTRFWSSKYYVIDAKDEGNVLRFINHSNSPNLKPLCLVDRGLLHLVFITTRPLKRGAQLTFDYGPDYWIHRKMVPNVSE